MRQPRRPSCRQALAECRRQAMAADVMLVIGTSGTVYPAADYPVQVLNAGGTVVDQELGLAVHVAGAVTHTIGGLQIDTEARVTGADGLWAAGVDAGGIATGGYASGLAQALVLGLVAAESIASL